MEIDKPEVWINIRRQEIIFDNEKCILLSLHNLSERHKLLKKQEEVDLYKKLHCMVTEHMIDPLSLISLSASWLIKWMNKNCPNKTAEVNENLNNILVAAKINFFKCNNMLKLSGSTQENSDLR